MGSLLWIVAASGVSPASRLGQWVCEELINGEPMINVNTYEVSMFEGSRCPMFGVHGRTYKGVAAQNPVPETV